METTKFSIVINSINNVDHVLVMRAWTTDEYGAINDVDSRTVTEISIDQCIIDIKDFVEKNR